MWSFSYTNTNKKAAKFMCSAGIILILLSILEFFVLNFYTHYKK